MIISHKHKFIFIKTKKTAGTSIEIALSKICGDSDVITPIDKKDEEVRFENGGRSSQNVTVPLSRYRLKDLLSVLWYRKRIVFKNHMPAVTIEHYVSEEVWKTYYKFCFERHPVSKCLSHYAWRTTKGFSGTFDEYVNSGAILELRGVNFYTDSEGKISVDKVYKMEEMEKSFTHLAQILKIDPTLLSPPDFVTKKTFHADRSRTLLHIENNYHEVLKVLFKVEYENIYAKTGQVDV